jgi:hypothetical protein
MKPFIRLSVKRSKDDKIMAWSCFPLVELWNQPGTNKI